MTAVAGIYLIKQIFRKYGLKTVLASAALFLIMIDLLLISLQL